MVGVSSTLALGLYNLRRAATKDALTLCREEMADSREKARRCEMDRDALLTENRQLTRENVEYARRLLDRANGTR